ncbi:unnamed protein product [Lactuca saligna]|uniref:Uncharacterized protein n=1 Tax=Lactuca saligna TaxID=75948 RepID=A0AA35UYL7_LACSI|nr:unnamed protein product [Lactuca saligna]
MFEIKKFIYFILVIICYDSFCMVEEEEPKEGEETSSEDWELANETKLIWMRNPKEIEKDQYSEFYKKTFNEFLDPLAYTHFTIEGEVEFRSVIYIPGMAPMNNEDVVNPKTRNIRLYVKRVFKLVM